MLYPTGIFSRGPVWTDEDTGYVFYINSAIDVVYRKTTDGGASWGSAVEIHAGNDRYLSIWFDKWTPGNSGTIIHIWWLDVVDDDIFYRTLDTSSDTLGTERVVFAGASFSTASSRAVHTISGVKAVGGYLYVQFWGDSDGENGFYRSDDDGATWDARTNGADGNEADEVICLPDDDSGDNNDIVMIYWDRSADEISIKKYDDSDGASGSWGETSISGSMVDTTLILQMSAVVRHSDGNIIVAAWSELDPAGADADLKVWDITLATPTIAGKTDVITDTDDCICAALFIDQNNDDLYCAYLGNEDGSETWLATLTAFYKKSDDGGATWGSQTTYQADTADDERYIDAGHSTPGNAAGRFEPAFFNQDLLDIFVNVDNSVEITAVTTAVKDIIGVGVIPFAR